MIKGAVVTFIKTNGKTIGKAVAMATVTVVTTTVAALSQEGLIGAAKELITKK